jgi:hypothetical protein
MHCIGATASVPIGVNRVDALNCEQACIEYHADRWEPGLGVGSGAKDPPPHGHRHLSWSSKKRMKASGELWRAFQEIKKLGLFNFLGLLRTRPNNAYENHVSVLNETSCSS